MSDLESREESLIHRNFSICVEKAASLQLSTPSSEIENNLFAKTTSENMRVFMHSISKSGLHIIHHVKVIDFTGDSSRHQIICFYRTSPTESEVTFVLPRSTIYIAMSGMPQILIVNNRQDRRESILNPKLHLSPQRPFYLSYTQNFLLDFNSYSINLIISFHPNVP